MTSGVRPRRRGAPYGSDLRLYNGGGIPSIHYGPGEVRYAHSADRAGAPVRDRRHGARLGADRPPRPAPDPPASCSRLRRGPMDRDQLTRCCPQRDRMPASARGMAQRTLRRPLNRRRVAAMRPASPRLHAPHQAGVVSRASRPRDLGCRLTTRFAAQLPADGWQRLSRGRLPHRQHAAPVSASRRWAALLACGDGCGAESQHGRGRLRVRADSRRGHDSHRGLDPESTAKRSPSPGVRVRRSRLLPGKATVHDGWPITTAADTVLDLVAEMRSPHDVVALLTDACRSKAVTAEEHPEGHGTPQATASPAAGQGRPGRRASAASRASSSTGTCVKVERPTGCRAGGVRSRHGRERCPDLQGRRLRRVRHRGRARRTPGARGLGPSPRPSPRQRRHRAEEGNAAVRPR